MYVCRCWEIWSDRVSRLIIFFHLGKFHFIAFKLRERTFIDGYFSIFWIHARRVKMAILHFYGLLWYSITQHSANKILHLFEVLLFNHLNSCSLLVSTIVIFNDIQRIQPSRNRWFKWSSRIRFDNFNLSALVTKTQYRRLKTNSERRNEYSASLQKKKTVQRIFDNFI